MLSTVEVGKIIGVHCNQISRRCRQGEIEGAIQIGGRWFIPKQSVEKIKKGK